MTQTKTPPRSLPTLAATLALVTALSSCTTPAPTTTPSTPSPTFACTPEAGGSPYPCSSADYQEMKRKDALYAEAERVFRRLIAEDERVARIGGSDELTPEYKALLGSPELQKQQLEVLKSSKRDRVIGTGGSFVLSWVRRVPGISVEGSAVRMRACVDMTSVTFSERGKVVGPGIVVEETADFQSTEGRLRVWTFEYKVVPSCAAS